MSRVFFNAASDGGWLTYPMPENTSLFLAVSSNGAETKIVVAR